MRFEAFSAAKDPARPWTNDDRVVVCGTNAFAVIDGVTDKSGENLPNGLSRGQFAGVVIERELARLTRIGPASDVHAADLAGTVTNALHAEYTAMGILAEAERDPHRRCGAQVAALVRTPTGWRLLVIGDCGARLDGREAVTGANPGDALTSLWRATVFGALTANGAGVEEALALSRRYALVGNRTYLTEGENRLTPERHSALAAEALTTAIAQHPELPPEIVEDALAGGILGMAQHRNRPGPLGSACLDGFAVPDSLLIERDLPAGSFTTVELFSDGYFGTPAPGEVGVDAWEARIAEVERDDPHKVGAYPSTKGSAPGKFSDDRSVLVIRLERARAAASAARPAPAVPPVPREER